MNSTRGTERPTWPPALRVLPFPTPGPLVGLAYADLDLALNGTPEQISTLGNMQHLPRPWQPATCRIPELLMELRAWLDDVVTWLNHQYVWDPTDMIPSCWSFHPHLVHEIAVLADQRRRAGAALTSDDLDDWHRCSLPNFVDRMRNRTRSHCTDAHAPWPSKGRYARHFSKVDDAEHQVALTSEGVSDKWAHRG